MKFTKLKAVGIAAGVAALACITTPANAVAPPIADPSGVDYDAACILGNPAAPVPTPNYIPSTNPPGAPGGSLALPPGGTGCQGISIYDGGTESTDLRSVDLKKNAAGQLEAAFTVDGAIPAPGSTVPPALGAADLPNNATFVGFGYKAMFQNEGGSTPATDYTDGQQNTPYIAGTRVGTGTPIYGLNEHWKDGFHHFVGFDAVFDGSKWIYSAQIGTYDSGPDGGFFFDELGTSNSMWDHDSNPLTPLVPQWVDDDPCFTRAAGDWDATVGPGTATVKVKGVVEVSNVQAVGGCVEAWYAKTNDDIINIKGLSTADFTVTLPVTVPLSLLGPGFSDLTSVGGLVFPSDMTAGNSRNVGLNSTLATATGDNPLTNNCTLGHTNEGLLGNRLCVSFTGGLYGLADKLGALVVSNLPPDTLGDGPRCWTSTVGGILPQNPLWVAGQECYIDDDSAPGPNGNIPVGEGGTILAEWWDTNYDFPF